MWQARWCQVDWGKLLSSMDQSMVVCLQWNAITKFLSCDLLSRYCIHEVIESIVTNGLKWKVLQSIFCTLKKNMFHCSCNGMKFDYSYLVLRFTISPIQIAKVYFHYISVNLYVCTKWIDHYTRISQ